MSCHISNTDLGQCGEDSTKWLPDENAHEPLSQVEERTDTIMSLR